jgi:hypothetical protein
MVRSQFEHARRERSSMATEFNERARRRRDSIELVAAAPEAHVAHETLRSGLTINPAAAHYCAKQ